MDKKNYTVIVCFQELLKYSEYDDDYESINKALLTMTLVVKYVNDLMHQNLIRGFTVRNAICSSVK